WMKTPAVGYSDFCNSAKQPSQRVHRRTSAMMRPMAFRSRRPLAVASDLPSLPALVRLGSASGFPLGDAGRQHQIAGYVERGAAHVKDAINAQDDADSLAGNADARQQHHDQRNGPARNAS